MFYMGVSIMLFVVVLSAMFSVGATLLLRQWAHGDLRAVTPHATPVTPGAGRQREATAPRVADPILSVRGGALRLLTARRAEHRRGGFGSLDRVRTATPSARMRPDGNGMAVERMRRCRPSHRDHARSRAA